MDYATSRIFLRRVGGGYVFVQRMLLEYFADLKNCPYQAEQLNAQESVSD